MSERADEANKTIWWIFFLLGMGTLLPWNFFITPYMYWLEKLELNQTDTETGEPVPETYQAFWGSTMALATMGTNFVMCFLTSILMNKIGRNVRFMVPICGIGFCFVIAAYYTTLPTGSGPDEMAVASFFAQTMINVVIITGFCAVLQASLFGHGAEVGKVIPAIMGGQGVGGIMASFVDILTKLIYDEPNDASMLFFIIPSVFMILTAMAYMYLQKLPEYQDLLAKKAPSKDEEKVELNENSEKLLATEGAQEKSIREVIFDFKNGIAVYMFCIFFTFTVTLGLFPAVCQGLQPSSRVPNEDGTYEPSQFYDRFFLTICVFLMFNLTDTVGRMSSEYVCRPGGSLNFIKPNQEKLLLIIVVCRLVFVLLFSKCNVFPSERDPENIWFHSDIVFVIIMIFFGVSNGLCSSIAMNYAPQRAPEYARERIGGFMGTVLVAGLFSGATCSFMLVGLAKSI